MNLLWCSLKEELCSSKLILLPLSSLVAAIAPVGLLTYRIGASVTFYDPEISSSIVGLSILDVDIALVPFLTSACKVL